MRYEVTHSIAETIIEITFDWVIAFVLLHSPVKTDTPPNYVWKHNIGKWVLFR